MRNAAAATCLVRVVADSMMYRAGLNPACHSSTLASLCSRVPTFLTDPTLLVTASCVSPPLHPCAASFYYKHCCIYLFTDVMMLLMLWWRDRRHWLQGGTRDTWHVFIPDISLHHYTRTTARSRATRILCYNSLLLWWWWTMMRVGMLAVFSAHSVPECGFEVLKT